MSVPKEGVLFVSFLYKLDLGNGSDKRRSWDEYMRRLNELCARVKLTGCRFLVFAEDKQVLQTVAQHGSSSIAVSAPPSSFREWNRRDEVRAALQKKPLPIKNIELVSAEYTCLTNCKFEALIRAVRIAQQSLGLPITHACWVDAGMRSGMLEGLQQLTWYASDDRLRVPLYNLEPPTEWICLNVPMTCILATAFGGSVQQLEWLEQKTSALQDALLQRQKCGCDQQLMSMLYKQNREKFKTTKLFARKLPFSFLVDHEMQHVLRVLDDDAVVIADTFASWQMFAVVVALFLLLLLALKRMLLC